MPQAYDYIGQMRMADPADVFLQSLQIGQQLKKQAQQRELMERRQETYAKLGPNATTEDFIAADPFYRGGVYESVAVRAFKQVFPPK